MRQVQKNWLGSAVGLRMNPDKRYDLQCVDVADHYAEAIFPGVPWQTSLGGVAGAKDLLGSANRNYWTVIHNDPSNAKLLPQAGDVIVWGGSPSNGWGHTGVATSVRGSGASCIQQNSNGLANQAAHLGWLPWYGIGTGMVTGWLRPRADKMPPDVHVPATKTLTVSASVAVVRTSPHVRSNNVSKRYPQGIAKGAKVAVLGYVAGQDPYPNDRRVDNAWVKTIGGEFIWANAVGNSLKGLARL